MSKLTPAQRVTATSLAQVVMQGHWGTRPVGPPGRPPSVLRVDGKWGTYTDYVYSASPASVQAAVRAQLAAFGTTAEELASLRAMERIVARPEIAHGEALVVNNLKRYFDFGAVSAAIRSAVRDLEVRERLARERVPDPEGVIAIIAGPEIINLEAARARDGSYDAFSQAGTTSAAGLFQFIASTWNVTIGEIRRAYPSLPIQLVPTTVPESKGKLIKPGGPFDMVASCYCYTWLTTMNALALKRTGLAINVGTLYTLHQQGSSGGIAYLRGRGNLTNAGAQSSSSLRLMAAARASSQAA